MTVIIESLDVVDSALSDHRTVFCSLSLRKPGRVKQQETSRNLRRIDPTGFQTDVSQVASSLAECPDCELLEELNTSLRNVFDRHAPQITRTPVRSVDHREVKAVKCNLRKAERRWRSSGLTVHKQIFIEQTNVKKRVILSAKRKHFCDELSKCNSSKQLYGLANELLGNS